jgi:hypothetical protein
VVDRATFRAAFPEFANPSAYPDATVDFWLNQAQLQYTPDTFGDSYDLAIMLFVAHYLATGARNAAVAQAGGVPGAVTGVASSKSVGGVSVSYDVGASSMKDAGYWNTTTYGQRFWELLQRFATGLVYVPGPRRLPSGRWV